jgi:carnosine N-methyltransferase
MQVRYVLKNLVRDWSVEGAAEREASYGRIIQELRTRFADW